MRAMRTLLLLLALAVTPAHAALEDDDWALFGRVLALVQPIVHAAATSPDPQAAQREIDALLQGRNAEANHLAAELLQGALEDMPAEQRAAMLAIARDLLLIARREQARGGAAAAKNPPAAY